MQVPGRSIYENKSKKSKRRYIQRTGFKLECIITNLRDIKSSLELMLYCFIMCRIKIVCNVVYNNAQNVVEKRLAEFGVPT
jgi:hypothetical protein